MLPHGMWVLSRGTRRMETLGRSLHPGRVSWPDFWDPCWCSYFLTSGAWLPLAHFWGWFSSLLGSICLTAGHEAQAWHTNEFPLPSYTYPFSFLVFLKCWKVQLAFHFIVWAVHKTASRISALQRVLPEWVCSWNQYDSESAWWPSGLQQDRCVNITCSEPDCPWKKLVEKAEGLPGETKSNKEGRYAVGKDMEERTGNWQQKVAGSQWETNKSIWRSGQQMPYTSF